MYSKLRVLNSILFFLRNIYNDDRRFRHVCPLTNANSIPGEDIQEQTLLNVPCNKTNEKFILFAHLQ
jgi:hypothetical protein